MHRRSDIALVACSCLFAITSIVMEPYFVFGIDYHRPHDPFALGWLFYAERWDPIFLRRPSWLRALCFFDFALYGPAYLAMIYGFLKRREWVRTLVLCHASAIAVTTLSYFAVEFLDEKDADLLMVVLVNLPYLMVPLAAVWRVRRMPVFGGVAHDRRDVAAFAAAHPRVS